VVGRWEMGWCEGLREEMRLNERALEDADEKVREYCVHNLTYGQPRKREKCGTFI